MAASRKQARTIKVELVPVAKSLPAEKIIDVTCKGREEYGHKVCNREYMRSCTTNIALRYVEVSVTDQYERYLSVDEGKYCDCCHREPEKDKHICKSCLFLH